MVISKCCNALPVGEPDTVVATTGEVTFFGHCSGCGKGTEFICDHEPEPRFEPADPGSGVREAHICPDCGVEVEPND